MTLAWQRLRYKTMRTRARAPFIWLRHRGLNSRDVFLASYPKSGSSWLRFQLFEILTGSSGGFDNIDQVFMGIDAGVGRHRRALRVLPGAGRFLQTHYPYRREYNRAVYVVRDGRDVVLSEYARMDKLGHLKYLGLERFDDFLPAFLRGKVNGYGPWHRHVLSWLDSPLAKSGNLLVIRFEDMRPDPDGSLKKVLEFLDVEVDPKVIQEVVQNNTLEKMRAKEAVAQKLAAPGFVRSGSVGGWRNRLTEAEVRLMEDHAGSALERMGYRVGSPLPI